MLGSVEGHRWAGRFVDVVVEVVLGAGGVERGGGGGEGGRGKG